MKKYIGTIIIILIVIFTLIFMFPYKKESKNKKIKVAEVTHSVFYAPQYVAYRLGYFKKENIDLDIILSSGADKVTAAVLSNDVQIGFCGSEATIYVYNQGEKDYLVSFAGLTKRDGSFLVGRNDKNFTLNNLINKKIIAGRSGGMPEMTLRWALKENKVDLNKVDLDTSISFAAMSGAFIGGTGDYVALFEPTASKLEKEGKGKIVQSIGELGGVVPYTAYNARKSFIEDNPDIIRGFNKAIERGLDYVHNHSSKEIANIIKDDFPDTNLNDLKNIIQRYKNIDSWFDTSYISEKDFNHIQEIMIYSNQLNKIVDYKKLVYTKYATKK